MLTNKEILQIDATILAGLLILTTVISLEYSTDISSIWTDRNNWTFWIGWGFSFSAICAILASMIDETKYPDREKAFRFLSMAFMLTGFVFMVIIFFVIAEYESLVNTGIIDDRSNSTG